MKKINNIILFASMILLAFACKDANDSEAKAAARSDLKVRDNVSAPVANSNSVQHYYCSNGCEGSGGNEQGTCPTCGQQYLHNAAFHTQSSDPLANPNITVNPTQNSGAITPAAQSAPAQNEAGVYHYTCSAGCPGGSGAKGTCASCGTTLVHNQAYHSN